MRTFENSSHQMLLGDILIRNDRKNPKKKALVCAEKYLTYGMLNSRVNCLANMLNKMGIKKGDKVAILSQNRAEVVESCFAVFKLGAIAVPINFRLTASEIKYVVNNSESKIIILENEMVNKIQRIRSKLNRIKEMIIIGEKIISDGLNYESIIKDASTDEPHIILNDDEGALILYTSGTTGRPKGAIHSHKSFMLTSINYIIAYHTQFEDKWVCSTPLFHVAALGYCLTHFIMGATIYLEKDFHVSRVLNLIQNENITTLFFVPSMWIQLIEDQNYNSCDKSSIRIMTTAAAPMPVKIKKRLLSSIPEAKLYDCFGGTESGAVTVLRSKDIIRKTASVGKELPGFEIRLVDDEDRDVSIGDVGEAVYRGPSLMKGYYNNIAETKKAMRNGWFHSGDLLKQDDEGYFYVVDRKKDMIISGGENIYPAEVEQILFKHPRIIEAAVIGVPDNKWGQSVRAYVVLKPGKEVTENELIDYCKKYIASYKKPKSIKFVDILPKNAAGKILKTALK